MPLENELKVINIGSYEIKIEGITDGNKVVISGGNGVFPYPKDDVVSMVLKAAHLPNYYKRYVLSLLGKEDGIIPSRAILADVSEGLKRILSDIVKLNDRYIVVLAAKAFELADGTKRLLIYFRCVKGVGILLGCPESVATGYITIVLKGDKIIQAYASRGC